MSELWKEKERKLRNKEDVLEMNDGKEGKNVQKQTKWTKKKKDKEKRRKKQPIIEKKEGMLRRKY